MIDIKVLRQDPEAVRENLRKKYQEAKLPLVDEILALDEEFRSLKQKADELRP